MNQAKGGIGFLGVLQIAFIVLKLLNVINWSWVIVLLPLIISTIFGIIFLIVYIAIIRWFVK